MPVRRREEIEEGHSGELGEQVADGGVDALEARSAGAVRAAPTARGSHGASSRGGRDRGSVRRAATREVPRRESRRRRRADRAARRGTRRAVRARAREALRDRGRSPVRRASCRSRRSCSLSKYSATSLRKEHVEEKPADGRGAARHHRRHRVDDRRPARDLAPLAEAPRVERAPASEDDDVPIAGEERRRDATRGRARAGSRSAAGGL